MEKFEYKIYRCYYPMHLHEENINEFGEKGWELINVLGHVDDPDKYTYYYFKRKIKENV